ncbi:hypothetical protein [Streptomyces pseudovenezuelae]|uniref:Uncharacterized protein n=1 Tax=Streptomyces pseudovenezuelae TaxID=67350 RepID=A0ABT6M242_9ACTN|nr:hypothetical protein [Streptomyces pseudovenezuelae]MDH6222637.1 hypothetical protein [Streptomyces pseudovenezuelae]
MIADAAPHDTAITGEEHRKPRSFTETDPATMNSEHLATKLTDHTRLRPHQQQPVGRPRSRQRAAPGTVRLRWHPVSPRALFVLTGASRYVLGNRIGNLQAIGAERPLVGTPARHVPMGAAVLQDLVEQRPTDDVWASLAGGKSRPWSQL